MSYQYESDDQSDVGSSPTFYSSSQGRFRDTINFFGSTNRFSGFDGTNGDDAGLEYLTPSGDGHDSSSRGTLLKIQRFEQVYDPATNKTVALHVDETQAQDDKKGDPSADNVFNVWRTVTPSPFNPAALPRVSVAIDIKSVYLRTTCKAVIGGYMGVSWTVEPLKVDPKTFIAYLPKLEKFANDLSCKEHRTAYEATALSHLEFLISFTKVEYADQVSEINSYLRFGEITFNLLWAIMLYRTPIFTNCTVTGQPRLGWINGMDIVKIDGRMACILEADCIDYNSWSHRSDSKQHECRAMLRKSSSSASATDC